MVRRKIVLLFEDDNDGTVRRVETEAPTLAQALRRVPMEKLNGMTLFGMLSFEMSREDGNGVG